jgi:hypothetical protein
MSKDHFRLVKSFANGFVSTLLIELTNEMLDKINKNLLALFFLIFVEIMDGTIQQNGLTPL